MICIVSIEGTVKMRIDLRMQDRYIIELESEGEYNEPDGGKEALKTDNKIVVQYRARYIGRRADSLGIVKSVP